ncbi:MAG: J domain-containing protein [Deltaproteobacteria bacterium]|nr:J domain-containing protein [Deltaproteobacteria bacterium]
MPLIIEYRLFKFNHSELMDIRRSFQILELEPGVSEAEVRQAYKDIVSVWHPDRFSNNPRLRARAEEKVKEINQSYETVLSFIAFNNGEFSETATGSGEGEPSNFTAFDTRSKTELAAELGTGMVLGLYAFLSKRLRRFLSEP